MRQVNAREDALYLFFSFLVAQGFVLLRVPPISSYLLPIVGPFATAIAIRFDYSKMNFIDIDSFEGNHATFSGSHGKFDDAV